jgi:hypothetical protein
MNLPGKKPAWLSPLLVICYFAITASLLPPVLFFEQGSDGIIVDSLRNSRAQSVPSPFMIRVDPRGGGEPTPYYSQFGLTYRALLPFRHYLPHSGLHVLLSLAWALATGAVFWWFYRRISLCHGSHSGTLFLLLCCGTPTFLLFSGSFYWQLPLLLAPFMIAYAFASSRPVATSLWVFGLLFLRFLGGYEYTSTLLLSPIAALLLRSALGDIPLRRTLQLACPLAAAGFLAFLAALSLHLVALASAAGGWRDGMSRFSQVAQSRTNGDFLGREISLKGDLIELINSFFHNEVILVCGLAAVTLFLAAANRGRAAALRIGSALLFAFLCSLSWQVLARGHMRDHALINFIVYFIPFGLSVYLAFSRVVGELVSSHKR